jgi:hypothetical protein
MCRITLVCKDHYTVFTMGLHSLGARCWSTLQVLSFKLPRSHGDYLTISKVTEHYVCAEYHSDLNPAFCLLAIIIFTVILSTEVKWKSCPMGALWILTSP